MSWPNVSSTQPHATVEQQLTAIEQAALADNQAQVAALAVHVRGLVATPTNPANPEAAVNLAWAASVTVPPQWGTALGELGTIQ